jgi:hypothetical protein
MASYDSDLVGNVDRYKQNGYLAGWVIDRSDPGRSDIEVCIKQGSDILATTLANMKRGDGYHGFLIPISSADFGSLLLQRKVDVCAVQGESTFVPLNLYRPMLVEIERSLAEEQKMTSTSVTTLENESPPRSNNRSSAIPVDDTLSPMLVSTGVKSPDGSAVVGRNGYLFLYKGSNDVVSLYGQDENSPEVERIAQRWFDLFEARRTLINRFGSQYVQLVIPEKSTILINEAPPELGPITPVLKTLESLLDKEWGDFSRIIGVPRYYDSILLSLRAASGGSPFLRTDSHLSVTGCWQVVLHLLSQIEPLLPADREAISRAVKHIENCSFTKGTMPFSGDLGGRFSEFKIYELADELDSSSFTEFGTRITKDVIKDPKTNAHNGMQIVWRNKDAPIKARVLAFANSFFERGEASRGLSWWFKHLFSEFHFVWSPDVNEALISTFRPDLVVCQTVERFLTFVPKV